MTLFTRVRGRSILRTSPLRSSRKFAGPQGSVLLAQFFEPSVLLCVRGAKICHSADAPVPRTVVRFGSNAHETSGDSSASFIFGQELEDPQRPRAHRDGRGSGRGGEVGARRGQRRRLLAAGVPRGRRRSEPRSARGRRGACRRDRSCPP